MRTAGRRGTVRKARPAGSAGTGLLPTTRKRRRLATVLALTAFLLPQGAVADLVGTVDERAAVAGRSDAALIDANPLLRRLRGVDPDSLREALERLRSPAGAPRRSLEPPAPPEAESGVLDENPDIETLYHESPEAALDLIRLIREAAKEK